MLPILGQVRASGNTLGRGTNFELLQGTYVRVEEKLL